MIVDLIKTSISTLPGIGKATSSLFARLNIFTIGELLTFFPRTYEDRTKKIPIRDFEKATKIHTIAKVLEHDFFGYGRMKTLKIFATDGTGIVELVAFNRPFLEKTLPIGSIFALDAVCQEKYSKITSSSFETKLISKSGDLKDYENSIVPESKIFAIYRLTEGLSQKIVRKAISTALEKYANTIDDEIPKNLLEKRNLFSKSQSLLKIHNPKNFEEIQKAQKSLAYEELFLLQKKIAQNIFLTNGTLPEISAPEDFFSLQKNKNSENINLDFKFSPRQKSLLKNLPFELTHDQKLVIQKLSLQIDENYGFFSDEKSKRAKTAMHALLQGDVGSGKTFVTFFAALRVIDYGGQCAILAPTEILSRQHAENAAKILSPLNVNVAFLTGNVKSAGRKRLLEKLSSGEINLIIGTHALFSRDVQYADLSFVAIDEQHRFGVLQRNEIFNKGRASLKRKNSFRETNFLMMSATPIPQTLALTFFGDLEIFTIKTLPQGRLPIKTFLVREDHASNAYEEVRKFLAQGRQAYFVYPAIDGANSKKLKSAQEMFDFLHEKIYPEFKVALIHGKIDDAQQAQILNDFRNKKIDVLVATTVVEVGVDVPNATCMVIEQAQQFGLSALHQLRGRVGRGDLQSYCFLIYGRTITENAVSRLKVLRETTDGFKIAEEDLRLRGPGEITGTAQSGDLEFAMAQFPRDEQLLFQARRDAFENFGK